MKQDATRRQFLVGVGVVGTAALAGCTDAGNTGGSQPTTDEEMTEGTEAGMDDGSMDNESMDDSDGTMATTLTVRVENVSTAETLQTSDGSKPGVLAPVAYAVHGEDASLFTEGEAASPGLETLAEDGGPDGLVEEASMSVESAGAAAVPEGGDEPGPITPGGAYTFSVEAHAGQRLSLATMFVQSNDLFYAPETSGIPLFDGDQPVEGDLTDRLILWDAGTEVNEEPGVGANQAPRQSGPDTGPAEDGVVRRIDDVDDGFDYPDTASVIKLTVSTGEMMDG
ncbi:hypothetical protein C440_01550 [Haloferax mucosum ATCC BAA-1512]|uniref:Spondin domain-containing protein n=1 Tax=Haloferax mucosum ATCC BAA-1512 TaxID=662479 RepID=M0IQN0_9EURY|nr:spondin domain-containing protein [Haloferax mucosum]ELZ99000.1 hypothetical protein C440_01550 [Haloferax mucosum ATCC BAA-1512]